MKLSNSVLIYDDLCPLCTWYTGLFVRFRFLSPEGRVPFSRASPSLLSKIELQKGQNEIPLVDLSSQEVHYGIDAMLIILAHRFPFLRTVGNIHPINWVLKKLYKLISFNRKVIVAQKCGMEQFDCSPEFNGLYRFTFLFIFLVFNSVMLFPIHILVLSDLSFYKLNFLQLQSAHLLFVFSNCVIATLLPYKAALEYLGQVNMLALSTVLLCLPLILLDRLFPANAFLITTYLLALTLFVIKEYFRRMDYAGILARYKAIPKVNFLCLAIFLLYLFI